MPDIVIRTQGISCRLQKQISVRSQLPVADRMYVLAMSDVVWMALWL